ncbi:MAG: type II toxin-antitoxin system HicB family antitoxin [Euryarchaeota archaeon]|nr:type II toxin-antitoxin system HicB family antitoxin [Euryarchaeota archaeon]
MEIKPIELRYTILIERNEEGSYTVTVPLLSGCITEGDTWEEAIANAKEAIAGYIGALKDLGKPIPLEIPVEVNAESIL